MKGKKLLYYAVSRRGQGIVFTNKPKRFEKLGLWSGTIEGFYCSVVADMEAAKLIKLPSLSYEDDPVEITISLNYESPKTK